MVYAIMVTQMTLKYIFLLKHKNGLDVKAWISLNVLSLNESKMEMVIFTPSDTHCIPNLNLAFLAPYVKPYVKIFGCGVRQCPKARQTSQSNCEVKFLSVANPGKNKVLSFFC